MITERIAALAQQSFALGNQCITSRRKADYHHAALTMFSHLPLWEKQARAMAYSIVNQPVNVLEGDRIGGRVYHGYEEAVETLDPDLDDIGGSQELVLQVFPEAEELKEQRLIGGRSRGHITWMYDRILSMGTTGLRKTVEEKLAAPRDREAEAFYRGVLILLDAMQTYNDLHIAAYEKIGNHTLARRMEKVPRYPAENFREAVQAWFMQHIVVMSENPYGGNSPGRLDYYLWPYLKKDLENGNCTLEEAKEVVDELFLRLDERIHTKDGWVEAIVVGGTAKDGTSAVNPLTYLMIQSIMDLNITHPSIYVRMPAEPPKELLELCAKYLMSGTNKAQILNDPSVIQALTENGVPFEDAVEYVCGGCMEISVQGKNSDFLYIGSHSIPKILELAITGGICLRTGKRISSFQCNRGLEAYPDFESFYRDFMEQTRRLIHMYLKIQDIYSEHTQKTRPSYLISSMLDDCIGRGRNMHAGGVKYHNYGATPLAMPDAADALYAIKVAVFEDKICSAQELVSALKADFVGYEKLQAALTALPKYGIDHDGADEMAARLMTDISDCYLQYRNRWGGIGMPVILTFVYGPGTAERLGATACGRNAGKMIAHGITPNSASMTEGFTAAMLSLCKMPTHKFAGGASSMWDFDGAWMSQSVMEAIIKTFLEKNGQIFQGNITSVETLQDAQRHPENYGNLIVRVGGYSARFVNLSAELQNDIINRIHH